MLGMEMVIVVPDGTRELVAEVFKRTGNYIKMKQILKTEYGIEVRLERKKK